MRRNPVTGQFMPDPGGLLLNRQRQLRYEMQRREAQRASEEGSALKTSLKWGLRIGVIGIGVPLIF